jgi:hypothetical protein
VAGFVHEKINFVVWVRNLNGRTLAINISPLAALSALKDRVCDMTGIPAPLQVLRFKGAPMGPAFPVSVLAPVRGVPATVDLLLELRGGPRRASARRFIDDAAAGSGSDNDAEEQGRDEYDLEDAFIDKSEDAGDEEGMHAALLFGAQHLRLGLAPPDGGCGSGKDDGGMLDLVPPDGGGCGSEGEGGSTDEDGVVDFTKRRRSEPPPAHAAPAPARVSGRAKRPSSKLLFSQHQRESDAAAAKRRERSGDVRGPSQSAAAVAKRRERSGDVRGLSQSAAAVAKRVLRAKSCPAGRSLSLLFALFFFSLSLFLSQIGLLSLCVYLCLCVSTCSFG